MTDAKDNKAAEANNGNILARCCAVDPDFELDSAHLLLLRIIGALCIIFSIIEICVGAAVYDYLLNLRLGAWWCGIPTLFAGICSALSLNRSYVIATCVFASLAFVITLAGAVTDGLSSTIFHGISACMTTDSFTDVKSFYGNAASYDAAEACQIANSNSVINGCYCVGAKSFCGEYTLSSSSIYAKQNCGNILTNYRGALATSTTFCVVSFVTVFCLSLITGTLLLCPTRSPIVTKRHRESAAVMEVGVNGELSA